MRRSINTVSRLTHISAGDRQRVLPTGVGTGEFRNLASGDRPLRRGAPGCCHRRLESCHLGAVLAAISGVGWPGSFRSGCLFELRRERRGRCSPQRQPRRSGVVAAAAQVAAGECLGPLSFRQAVPYFEGCWKSSAAAEPWHWPWCYWHPASPGRPCNGSMRVRPKPRPATPTVSTDHLTLIRRVIGRAASALAPAIPPRS